MREVLENTAGSRMRWSQNAYMSIYIYLDSYMICLFCANAYVPICPKCAVKALHGRINNRSLIVIIYGSSCIFFRSLLFGSPNQPGLWFTLDFSTT